MQHDPHSPSNTFITGWEAQRDAPPTVEETFARIHEPKPWAWGWKWWLGIHYGPIPVGAIVVIVWAVLAAASGDGYTSRP